MTLAHIGRFQVERALGSGSYATVWLAHDEDLDAWVAIKLLAENWSMNGDARRRFMDEARALRRLDSDRIVRVYEVGHLADGRPYMVMEFADRGTLEDRMRLRGQLDQPFSEEEAVGLSLDIAECLIAVHDLRIVHRDVKPSNVLFRGVPRERQEALRRDGRPVAPERTLLGDFGIARRLEGLLGHTMIVGSPQYMAPEQADPARAGAVDYRSDVYSAAVIVYEILTGRVPFSFESPADLVRIQREAPSVRTLRSDVSASLADVIGRGLARDPAERFPSAWEWREALRSASANVPGAGRRMDEGHGRLVDLRPGHAAPEVDTVPMHSVADSGTGEASGRAAAEAALRGRSMAPVATHDRATAPAQTMNRTAPLPDTQAAAPAEPLRPIGQFPQASGQVSTLSVRVPGALICVAGVVMLASIFVPWGRVAPDVDRRIGVEFRAGAPVAIGGVFLFLFGLRMWLTRRRWVASLASGASVLVGIAGVGLAAVELILLDDPSVGLYLLLGSSVVAAFAGYGAQKRLASLKRQERYPLLRTP